MSYTVIFKPSAEREFGSLPASIQGRLAQEVATLAETPRPLGSKKLRARPGYRIRAGDHRVIYAIDDAARVVCILAIGHRRRIYQ